MKKPSTPRLRSKAQLAHLNNIFSPTVFSLFSQDQHDKLILTTSVECSYVRDDMAMYHICLKVGAKRNYQLAARREYAWGCTLDALYAVSKALGEFASHEGPLVAVDGIQYMIGDGDDSLAVWFEDGVFKIWLRTWYTEA